VGDWELRFAFGAVAAAVVAAAGYRRRALSEDGAIAAWLVGTVIVAFGGWWWGVLVVLFFASSTALGRIGTRRPEQTRDVRGNRRDLVQVGANGGIAALLAALAAAGDRELLFAAFAGTLAAATADTWATELGRFSRVAPRSIFTGMQVAPGASGGVTRVGTAGAMAGALVIGGVAAVGVWRDWAPSGMPSLALFAIVTGAGFSAALLDSVLGATLQANYGCRVCEEETESPVHRCGRETVLLRGIPAVTNDIVNLLATLGGAGLAGLAAWSV